MVAKGDHVGTGIEDVLGLVWGDAHGGGVFAVDDGEVGAGLIFQPAQAAAQALQAGCSHHVAHA